MAFDRRLVLECTNRVETVRRRRRWPTAIGPRGGLGKAGCFGEGYALAWITRGGSVDAWRFATHRSLHMLVRCDSFWEKSQATAVVGVTGPSVVRLDAADILPAALRSRSR